MNSCDNSSVFIALRLIDRALIQSEPLPKKNEAQDSESSPEMIVLGEIALVIGASIGGHGCGGSVPKTSSVEAEVGSCKLAESKVKVWGKDRIIYLSA